MGNPWEIVRNNISYPVKFYGKVVTDSDASGDGLGSSKGGSLNEKESAVGFLEAWKIPGVASFTVSVEYLRNDQRCQDKVEEDNGVRNSDDGVENESEKDDVDESKEKEDAIEKMNETEHVSEETQENDENKKSETEATQENDGKYNEKSESEIITMKTIMLRKWIM
nr:alpha-1,4 glucan phosphorylase L isozyme, chloroplastic/amyloplastic isoform X2 [Tanacetum cinerariifolium]